MPTHMQSFLSFRQTICALVRQRRLANNRSLSAMENKYAKVGIYFSMAFIAIYLMGAAVMFSIIVNNLRTVTAVESLVCAFPFMLTIDFLLRFVVQQTPSQIARPYLLLPISRYACIDAFIFSSLFSWGNLTWFAFVLPYIIMSVVFSYGCATALLSTIFFLALVLANSQWYALIRTLVNDSMRWWILPAGLYAIIFAPLYLGEKAGLATYYDIYSTAGAVIERHNPLPIIAAIAVMLAMVHLNRRIQYRYVQKEVMPTEKKAEVRHIRQYHFLERYGEIGALLQLEIKLLSRNKMPRTAFLTGIVTVLVISIVIIVSDIYDSSGMGNFWGLYNFVLLGATLLIRIMGYEGNYIDCMLVHRENILALLYAKYIFYSTLLILPFTLMLPVVIAGKWPFLMLVSYAIYTMGFQYFLIFQMAVYNKQTIPLNEKITNKGGLDGNYVQTIVMAAVFIVPNVIINILQFAFSDSTSYAVMALIGAVFVATHKLWLRNIYKRMMARKYTNLESFATTR